MTPAPSDLSRVLERAEAFAGLLAAYGNTQNTPTEYELWAGCKDAAPVLADAARLIREMAADFNEYADHGLDERGVACPKGDLLTRRTASICTCGLASALARWRLS